MSPFDCCLYVEKVLSSAPIGTLCHRNINFTVRVHTGLLVTELKTQMVSGNISL